MRVALDFETFKTLSFEELRTIYGGKRVRLIYHKRLKGRRHSHNLKG
ncbi:bacteriocin [Helicobacter suis]|nr:bacteriocin [Helicobacter suis]